MPGAEIEGFAFAHTAARADQAFGLGAENAFRSCRRVGRGLRQHQGQGREQQKFHSAARSPRTQQARLEHARIVGHDQRVFRQQGGQIAEARMAQIEIAGPRHDQQPGCAPFFRRKLGNLLNRQLKMIVLQKEIRFLGDHGCHKPHRYARPQGRACQRTAERLG